MGQHLAMAEVLTAASKKLPHARLNPSPHHAMVHASFEEGERQKF